MVDPQVYDPTAPIRRERAFDDLLDDEELTSPTPVPGLLGLEDDEPSDVGWPDGTWRALDNEFIPVETPRPEPQLDWGWVMLMFALVLAAGAVVAALGTIAIS